jgi:glycosyltransferase involved in cell wall biosynthesis
MYDEDTDADSKYFPAKNFKGYGKHKMNFMAKAINKGRSADVVILSHVNLLPVGYLIKMASPQTKLILIAHGIEVWEPFTLREKRMIPKCDQILCVSEYTRNILQTVNRVPQRKLQVMNNCLDPFLEEPIQSRKDETLLIKYGFKTNSIILMTLTRLASTESYKGYDKVLEALPGLLKAHPDLKYLIVGNYDAKEKKRLDKKIDELGVEPYVAFSGFVPDEELARHFNLADIYIMPSWKEGFGIVFIEAMFYNKPVIAGNKDGSVDALLNGKLGLLVDPESLDEITAAINQVIKNKDRHLPDRQLLMENFGYEGYREKWGEILERS